jgi:ribonuclease-3
VRDLLDDLPDDLRVLALTHPAFARTRAESFERLEFLGDSVLGLAITQELYRRFPDLPEGDLTRVRAATVSRDSCEAIALASGLGDAMAERAAMVGDSHGANARRLATQRNALAALVESVIGASFLAHGFERTARGVVASFAGRIEAALENRIDARSKLQELASRVGAEVEWREAGEDGPPHERTFASAVTWTGRDTLRATGAGRSKQEAQHAAAAALLALIDEGDGEE